VETLGSLFASPSLQGVLWKELRFMKVYVAENVHRYPDVDGRGWIIGIYSSEEKARQAAEEARPEIEYYLGAGAKRAYEIEISEYDLDDLA
jgi:hypothetical protein